MSDEQQPSKTERFIRGAGEVREDPENKMWAPARWVVQMMQYLVAIMVMTVVEAFKAIVSGEDPKKRHQRHEEAKKK